jgi:hypothetical protein
VAAERRYAGLRTMSPYWVKLRSKVKAWVMPRRSMTAKLVASVKEKFLSVY